MLFDNVTKHTVSLSNDAADEEPPTLGYLIRYICENLIKDPRKELFVVDGAVYAPKISGCQQVTDTVIQGDRGSWC